MLEQYVHGYRPEENLRLHDQAGTLGDLLRSDTSYPPGRSVLEIGCGTGAQTVTLAQRSPGAHITAVDISAASLAEARSRVRDAGLDNVAFIEADVFDQRHAGGDAMIGRRLYPLLHRHGRRHQGTSRLGGADRSRQFRCRHQGLAQDRRTRRRVL